MAKKSYDQQLKSSVTKQKKAESALKKQGKSTWGLDGKGRTGAGNKSDGRKTKSVAHRAAISEGLKAYHANKKANGGKTFKPRPKSLAAFKRAMQEVRERQIALMPKAQRDKYGPKDDTRLKAINKAIMSHRAKIDSLKASGGTKATKDLLQSKVNKLSKEHNEIMRKRKASK